MARVEFSGIEQIDASLRKLERFETKRVVMAGADAAIKVLREATLSPKKHVKSRDMLNSIGPGVYKETLGGGSVEVYPQGLDSRGVRNIFKAKMIERGQGESHGDKFVSGSSTQIKLKAAVDEAMRNEVYQIFKEAGG